MEGCLLDTVIEPGVGRPGLSRAIVERQWARDGRSWDGSPLEREMVERAAVDHVVRNDLINFIFRNREKIFLRKIQ